jgi:predicted glycoside hydrolase/deacetylase ChbG (UPF0249 family)
VARYVTGKIEFSQVYTEWKNQIEFLIKRGIRPTHMNSHQHIHILPGLLQIAVRLQKEYKIKTLRFEPLEPFFMIKTMKRKLAYLLTKLITSFQKTLKIKHFSSHPFLGIGYSGGFLTENKIRTLISLCDHTTFFELNFHPGYNTIAESESYKSWNYDWENDLRLLCGNLLKRILEETGCELVRFRDTF